MAGLNATGNTLGGASSTLESKEMTIQQQISMLEQQKQQLEARKAEARNKLGTTLDNKAMADGGVDGADGMTNNEIAGAIHNKNKPHELDINTNAGPMAKNESDGIDAQITAINEKIKILQSRLLQSADNGSGAYNEPPSFSTEDSATFSPEAKEEMEKSTDGGDGLLNGGSSGTETSAVFAGSAAHMNEEYRNLHPIGA